MNALKEYFETRYSGRGRYFHGSYADKGIEAIIKNRINFPLGETAVYKQYFPYPLQRYLLVGDVFKDYLQGRIIDVGSRENVIFDALKIKAELVDKNSPNLPSFDWEKAPLPYDDNTFDTVVCLDTLEHINDFHACFEDLMRISKRYVIISIPNCWRKTFRHMLRGRSGQGAYGLPLEKQFDRHKWFFNSEEMEDFMFYNSVTSKFPFRVIGVANHIPVSRGLHNIIYPFVRWFLPARYMKNLVVNTSFFALEKISE